MENGISRSWSVCWLILFVFITTFHVQAQSEKKGKPKGNTPDCGGNCFSTEVVKAEVNEEGCVEYELKVSHDGTCRYDLSHFTVAVPCGEISGLTNSRNWKQEIGTDPTTGLKGFKIDDIPSFGKDSDSSFTVSVTICSDSTCLEQLGVVAYKAGQCVDYDTLDYEVIDPGDGDDGDGDDDDGNGDGGDGDDGDGDGGDNGGGDSDSTQTCSTLSARVATTSTSCYGSSDGTIEVIIEDGKYPVQYRWSTGSSDSVLFNLAAGIYSVTLTDANGNILTLSGEISQPDNISISESVFNPSCSGNANGFINLTVSGGQGGYTYAWSNGATTQNISNLSSGLYTVTVTDSTGCSNQKSFMLSNESRVQLSGSVLKAGCGQANGAVDVTVSGGTSPYTFAWDNGATTEDIQNLSPGSYRVVVTDAVGCTAQAAYVVSENNAVRVNFTTTQAGCFNEATGSIDITASGGTAPYTYSWQHGPTTEDLTGLVSGIYRVTVTDNAGCSVLTAINIPKKSIQVATEIIQPLCSGDSTGSIIVTPVDGTTTYTYSWSNGGTSNSISDVPVGTYIITITDASGCSRTLSYTITQPAPISATTTVTNSQCGEEGAFAIDLSVSGGKAPYMYLWSTGASTQDLTSLNSGSYGVQITDANGCTTSTSVSINPSSAGWACLINEPANAPACSSVGNTLMASVTDAQQYTWSVSSSDNSWIITSGGSASSVIYSAGTSGSTATFTLTIEKDGCTRTCTYEVSGGCVVRDNTGGGDPSTGDPCADTTATAPIVDATPPAEPESAEAEEVAFKLSVYPNPFVDNLTFEWTADRDDVVRVEILDQLGRSLTSVYVGQVRKGETYSFDWTGNGLRDRTYYYKFTSSNKSTVGKLFRR